MDIKKVIKENELFKGLPGNAIDEIAPMFDKVYFKHGETIISKGDKEGELFLVMDGKVNLEIDMSEESDPVLLTQISKNEVFGELCLLNNYWRAANAVAMDDSVLLKINRDVLLSFFASYPNTGYIVMRNLAEILSTRLVATNIQLMKARAG